MAQAIGFAEKFYTLWSIEKEPNYTTDSYGKHWLTGHTTRYTYHKNISMDLDKVKRLYPNLPISNELRGITRSWVSDNKEEDLCPHIMKFGKYHGRDVNELLNDDFQYLLWICENKSFTSNGKYANELPKIKQHYQSIEDEKNKLINSQDAAFAEVFNRGFYDFVPEKNLRIYDSFAYIFIREGNLRISFKFNDGSFSYNRYNDIIYGLPIIFGKAKKIKGKSIRIEFSEKDRDEPYQVLVSNVKFL
jgi:uncharacterized protein (DUF3820 family)